MRCQIVWKHTLSYIWFNIDCSSTKIFWCFMSAARWFETPKSHEQNNLCARSASPPDVAIKLLRYDSAVLQFERNHDLNQFYHFSWINTGSKHCLRKQILENRTKIVTGTHSWIKLDLRNRKNDECNCINAHHCHQVRKR